MSKAPKGLSTVEAAKLAGIRLDVLYPLPRSGRIEGRKIDGQWLVSATSVAAHVARRKQRPSKSV